MRKQKGFASWKTVIGIACLVGLLALLIFSPFLNKPNSTAKIQPTQTQQTMPATQPVVTELRQTSALTPPPAQTLRIKNVVSISSFPAMVSDDKGAYRPCTGIYVCSESSRTKTGSRTTLYQYGTFQWRRDVAPGKPMWIDYTEDMTLIIFHVHPKSRLY